MDAEPVDERDAMMDSLDPVEEIIGPMEGVGQGAPSLPPPPGRSPPLLVPAPPPPLVAPGSPPRSEHSPNEPPHARLSSSPYGPRRAGDLSFSLLLQRRSAEGKAEALPRFNLAAKGPEEGEPALQKSTQLPEFLPSTMVEMEPLSGLKWAEDDAVKQCAKCAVAFGYFLRKHHCRACGQIFCYRCSNCSFVLDHELGKFPEPHSNWWHSGGAMFRGRATAQRVCVDCNERLTRRRELQQVVQVFAILGLTVPELRDLALVCRQWHMATVLTRANFRNIQYKLPTMPLEQNQVKLLWCNRRLLPGHSRYLTKLVLTADWNKPEVAAEMLEILTSRPTKSCRDLLCSRYCRDTFSPQDALEVLCARKPGARHTPLVNHPVVREQAACSPTLQNLSDLEMSCYLPLLVSCLLFERSQSSTYMTFLFDRCAKSSALAFELDWALRVYISSSDSEVSHRFQLLHTAFRRTLSALETSQRRAGSLLSHLLRGEEFFAALAKVPKSLSENEARAEIRRLFSESKFFAVPLVLPLNPDVEVVGINFDKVKVKESATRPIQLPLLVRPVNSDSSVKPTTTHILYKQEDVRKDSIILGIFRLMDLILREEADLNLLVTTYPVVATSRDAGVLEFVPNSETLYAIQQGGYTIQNWINERNGDTKAGELRDRFVRSTAASSVISYLLGIGDRHLENIMVTADGRLFHIDFGFVLGKDPKPLAPRIRITPEMIDALGGEKSVSFSNYKAYCTKAFSTLRRHVGLFTQMILLLSDSVPPLDQGKLDFSREQLLEQVISRFLPGVADDKASLQFFTRIEESQNAISPSVHDWFHAQSKEQTLSSLKDRAIDSLATLVGWKK